MHNTCVQDVENLRVGSSKKCVRMSTQLPILGRVDAWSRGKPRSIPTCSTYFTQHHSTPYLAPLPLLLAKLSTLSTVPIISITN